MKFNTLENAKFNGVAPWENVEADLGWAVVYKDKYPVTEGHLLVVPRNNDSSSIERCFAEAYRLGKEAVMNGADGFNVGMNCGEAAGQTVMYPHIHMIPRREGDTENPRGGIRGVIPNKQRY